MTRLALLGICCASALFSFSCNKNEGGLTPSRIHQITRDLAAAASAALPSGTPIRLRQGASNQRPGNVDILHIEVRKGFSADSNSAAAAKLMQSLGVVITRYHLTQDPPTQTGELLHFKLRHFGVPTHEIEIAMGAASGSADAGGNSAGGATGAKLAIILDDLGSDRAAAEAIFALHYPLTVSILPNHEHSLEIAEEAHRRGYQVMLHLPMQSLANETQEAQELRPGMPAPEVGALIDQFLENVPGVAGVNNHQGSQATADGALMGELMPVLRERDLFYVDSRTTAATVAYDAAQSAGVRSAFRNVPFLDDVTEVPAVRQQLKLALRGAREKGEAVAIGHPHPATLQALREVLPGAQAQGVRLVFASELVH